MDFTYQPVERYRAIMALLFLGTFNISEAGSFDLFKSNVLLFGRVTESCTILILTHPHTMTPFDAPGKQAF